MDIFPLVTLVLLFFGVAVLYAAAGFGGGSSYLAILSFFPMHFHMMRSTALVCNIVVVGGSLWQFFRHKQINKNVMITAISFIVLSIPASYLMASLKIAREVFFVVLGSALFFSAISMWVSTNKLSYEDAEIKKRPFLQNTFLGGILGALAGLVGIGGGIFLSPLMHLQKMALPKEISVISTIFIFVNSFAGLTGQLVSNALHILPEVILALAAAVFIGGRLGVNMNIKKFNHAKIRRVTAIVIMIASVNVLIKGFTI